MIGKTLVMSQITKAMKQNQQESYDMNNLLSNLSYTYKEPSSLNQKSVIIEVPDESGTARVASENQVSQNFAQEPLFEKQIVFPCPQLSYNPTKCPPDLVKAEKHALSQRVSKFNPINPPDDIAESTGVPIHPAGFGLCCELKKLFHLGPVISMYFVFVKQLAFMSFLFCCIGAGILWTCPNKDLKSYEKTMDSLIQDALQAKKFITVIFATMLAFFVLMYIYRKHQKLTKLACKKSLITPSDYTVMAYDMGRNCSEEEVRAYFSNYIIPGFSLDAQRIVSTQDIEKYVDKVRQLKALLKNKQEAEKVANYISNGVVEDLQSKIDDIVNYFAVSKDLLTNYKGIKRNGTCFISYGNKQEAKTVRRRFEFSILERCLVWILEKVTDEFPEYFFKDQYFKVVKAPEVNEIIWEKLNCNTVKPGKRLLNFLVYSIIVAANFASAYYIRTSEQEEAYEYYRVYVVAIITAFLTLSLYRFFSPNFTQNPFYHRRIKTIIEFDSHISWNMSHAATKGLNEFILASVSFLARYGSFKTTTESHIAVQRKTIILQLINTAGPLLLLEYFFANKDDSIDKFFASDVVIIGCATTFLPLIIRFLNFSYRAKQALKKEVIKQVQTQGKDCGITQEEANSAFENPEFDINRVYIDTIRTLLFTCLFFCVSPAVALLAFVAFFLGYFVDKYNLLRKSFMPTVLRSEMAEAMFEFVDLSLLLFAISGNIFLDFAKTDNSTANFSHMTSTISLFTTILAGFYCISPNKRYARKLFPTKKPAAWNSLLVYQQGVDYMIEKDYYAANPCSKEPADKKEYLETYKGTHNSFKIVETLTQIPEILSIFNYADKRPAPHEIGVEFYTGLRNPYYSFPQNYRFGFDANNGGFSENSTIAEPLLIEQHLEKEFPQKKHVIKSNEMVPSSLLSNSGAINDKLSYGSQSVKGVSLLRDLKMIPSVNSNTSQINFEFREVSEESESYQLPAFGGAESVNTDFGNQPAATGFTLSSHDAAGILEGISPITGASLHKNAKK